MVLQGNRDPKVVFKPPENVLPTRHLVFTAPSPVSPPRLPVLRRGSTGSLECLSWKLTSRPTWAGLGGNCITIFTTRDFSGRLPGDFQVAFRTFKSTEQLPPRVNGQTYCTEVSAIWVDPYLFCRFIGIGFGWTSISSWW